MKLSIIKYTIEYQALEKLILPEYSGSSFRGVFGHALKQLSCMNLNEECKICDLSKQCIYSNIFETRPPEGDNPPFPGMSHIPHPFILRPGFGFKNEIMAGDTFSVDLNVFGDFIEWSNYFLKSLQNIGKMGVGKGNGKFSLERIIDRTSGSVVFEKDTWILTPEQETLFLEDGTNMQTIQMQINTQLRFVKKGRVVKMLTPEILFKEASRRFKTMVHYYGKLDDNYDYQTIIDNAIKINYQADLSFKKISRYSNRRRKYIDIDGLTGTMTMKNVPQLNYALLKVLEEVHLGKSTGMGLGHIKIWKS